jgi:hypothetical protein
VIKVLQTVYDSDIVPLKEAQTMPKYTIQLAVNPQLIPLMIYYPEGTYLYPRAIQEEDNGRFTACDNSTGHAWVEEFDTLQEAFEWVTGRKEVM